MNSTRGQRKAALYLASLSAQDRRRLLAALPESAARAVEGLAHQVAAKGWGDSGIVTGLLADELRGLTSETALTVEQLLAMARVLPADWTARLFAANSAMDRRFMLALLDGSQARRVEEAMSRVPSLPERLRDALLAEVSAVARETA